MNPKTTRTIEHKCFVCGKNFDSEYELQEHEENDECTQNEEEEKEPNQPWETEEDDD